MDPTIASRGLFYYTDARCSTCQAEEFPLSVNTSHDEQRPYVKQRVSEIYRPTIYTRPADALYYEHMEHNTLHHVSSTTCSLCGGPAPEWKCPECGLHAKDYDPSHWRECKHGTKMQSMCAACGQAELKCRCAPHTNAPTV
jgi:hypothetical protein